LLEQKDRKKVLKAYYKDLSKSTGRMLTLCYYINSAV